MRVVALRMTWGLPPTTATTGVDQEVISSRAEDPQFAAGGGIEGKDARAALLVPGHDQGAVVQRRRGAFAVGVVGGQFAEVAFPPHRSVGGVEAVQPA